MPTYSTPPPRAAPNLPRRPGFGAPLSPPTLTLAPGAPSSALQFIVAPARGLFRALRGAVAPNWAAPFKARAVGARAVSGVIVPRPFIGVRPQSGVLIPRLRGVAVVVETGAVLAENGDFILAENGDKLVF